jgi:hypothetical protein
VLEGVLGIGDFLMPNELVAKACYQFLAIGCDDLWVHWAPNRGGLLGFLPGSETPPDTAWLKPGVPRDGFPTVMKEGRYSPDGSAWERTIYLHCLVIAVGRPAIRLDQPICGTFAFRGKSCQIGQNFYRSQLKAVEAGGPSIEMARAAKSLRDSFKQGRAWASEPLPVIAAPPPTEAPQIPASERATPKSDSRPDSGKSDPPSTPPDEYDGDAGGPRSLDEVIFE